MKSGELNAWRKITKDKLSRAICVNEWLLIGKAGDTTGIRYILLTSCMHLVSDR